MKKKGHELVSEYVLFAW